MIRWCPAFTTTASRRGSTGADSARPEASLAEAAELWTAAQPTNPGHRTSEDGQRLAAARNALGWLHFLRCTELPAAPQHLSELARAIDYLGPLAHNPATIPEPLQALLCAAADAGRQADVAADLLRQVAGMNYPALLDASIWLLNASVTATPHNYPDRAGRLSNCGHAYRMRFERGGALSDLAQAIEIGTQAVDATSHGHPDLAGRLSNLGIAYLARFERSGALSDLDLAIETIGKAVDIPHGHSFRAAMVCNLGNAYRVRFERGGMLSDLDQAIKFSGQAVDAAPHDHPDRAAMLSNLGIARNQRYERSGMLTDLEHAIKSHEAAVDATPEGHPDRAKWLSNLGLAYRRRYERGGALADLDQAIKIGRQAVDATPYSHADRATMLSNLGIAYLRQFERSGALADLEHAIENAEQAVDVTPEGHPDRAKWLSNLGNACRRRFERRGTLADLDRAIESYKQPAVGAVPVRARAVGAALRMARFSRRLTGLSLLTRSISRQGRGRCDQPRRTTHVIAAIPGRCGDSEASLRGGLAG